LDDDAHLRVLTSSGAVVSELFDQILLLLPTDIGNHRRDAPAIHPVAGLADHLGLFFPGRQVCRTNRLAEEQARRQASNKLFYA
jgi:hypothetical protein